MRYQYSVPSPKWMPFDMLDWCEGHFGPEGRFWKYGPSLKCNTGEFLFANSKDAMLFALRWPL
jgi:hypothetical protein